MPKPERVLLASAYLGSIQYYTKLLNYNTICIEQYENFNKQSYRNRCHIYGANGLQSLTIPVNKGRTQKMLIKDVTLSYETAWPKNHLKSFESAYMSSPFYEFYIDDIRPFF